MAKLRVLIDSDVVINWLIKEKETSTGNDIWEAPHKIIEMAVSGNIVCYISIVSLLEIQHVMRRKKSISEKQIHDDIERITCQLEVLIPDEITLIQAFNLQKERPLDPFDSILLAQVIREEIILVSRDSAFLEEAAKKCISAFNPEDFLQQVGE